MIKNLVYLSIFTTFVVVVWIALSIYSSFSSSTISKDLTTQIIPLNPTLNASVIDSLEKRIQVPVDLSQSIGTPSAEGVQKTTITIGTTPAPTPTGRPSPTPTVILPTQAVNQTQQVGTSSGTIPGI